MRAVCAHDYAQNYPEPSAEKRSTKKGSHPYGEGLSKQFQYSPKTDKCEVRKVLRNVVGAAGIEPATGRI